MLPIMDVLHLATDRREIVRTVTGYSFSVLSLYAQVEVCSDDAVSSPQWDTDVQKVAADAQTILVATRPDMLGDVTVRVTDTPPTGALSAYEGVLRTGRSVILVGNSVAADFRKFRVDGDGVVGVSVYTNHATDPDEVTVVLPAGFHLLSGPTIP